MAYWNLTYTHITNTSAVNLSTRTEFDNKIAIAKNYKQHAILLN